MMPNHTLKLTRYGMRCLAAPGQVRFFLLRASNAHLHGLVSSNLRSHTTRHWRTVASMKITVSTVVTAAVS